MKSCAYYEVHGLYYPEGILTENLNIAVEKVVDRAIYQSSSWVGAMRALRKLKTDQGREWLWYTAAKACKSGGSGIKEEDIPEGSQRFKAQKSCFSS